MLNWFVEEEFSREARLLRDSYVNGLIDVAAPSLLPYEVLNALKYSAAFGEDELKEAAESLNSFQLTLHSLSGALASRAVEISMRRGITIYDACYVALAQQLKTSVYTADETLIRKAGDLGVKHISQFKV